jgi:hypothetical protein
MVIGKQVIEPASDCGLYVRANLSSIWTDIKVRESNSDLHMGS